jgi:hypothetical protein
MAIAAGFSRPNWRPSRRTPNRRRKDSPSRKAVVLPNERMQGGAISGGKVEERLQPYKDKVALHERNIEAIQKEIANLR